MDFEINKLLFFIFLFLCCACFVINYYNSHVSLIIKKLMRLSAFSEDTGKTVAELGLSDSKISKDILTKRSGVISKIVYVVGMKKISYEEYVETEKKKKLLSKLPKEERESELSKINSALSGITDIETAKFYIPDDMRQYAERTYKNKNGSILKTALLCLLIMVFYLVLASLMPSILTAIDYFI